MKVIVKKITNKKHFESYTGGIYAYKAKRQIQTTDVLRELWEKEYNSWCPEPVREQSYFEEDYCRIENSLQIVEFIVTNVVEVDL